MKHSSLQGSPLYTCYLLLTVKLIIQTQDTKNNIIIVILSIFALMSKIFIKTMGLLADNILKKSHHLGLMRRSLPACALFYASLGLFNVGYVQDSFIKTSVIRTNAVIRKVVKTKFVKYPQICETSLQLVIAGLCAFCFISIYFDGEMSPRPVI